MTSPANPLADLAAAPPTKWSRRPGECMVARLTADNETLRFLIEESGHPGSTIAQACREAGISISGETITRHRRKACACPAA